MRRRSRSARSGTRSRARRMCFRPAATVATSPARTAASHGRRARCRRARRERRRRQKTAHDVQARPRPCTAAAAVASAAHAPLRVPPPPSARRWSRHCDDAEARAAERRSARRADNHGALRVARRSFFLAGGAVANVPVCARRTRTRLALEPRARRRCRSSVNVAYAATQRQRRGGPDLRVRRRTRGDPRRRAPAAGLGASPPKDPTPSRRVPGEVDRALAHPQLVDSRGPAGSARARPSSASTSCSTAACRRMPTTTLVHQPHRGSPRGARREGWSAADGRRRPPRALPRQRRADVGPRERGRLGRRDSYDAAVPGPGDEAPPARRAAPPAASGGGRAASAVDRRRAPPSRSPPSPPAPSPPRLLAPLSQSSLAGGFTRRRQGADQVVGSAVRRARGRCDVHPDLAKLRERCRCCGERAGRRERRASGSLAGARGGDARGAAAAAGGGADSARERCGAALQGDDGGARAARAGPTAAGLRCAECARADGRKAKIDAPSGGGARGVGLGGGSGSGGSLDVSDTDAFAWRTPRTRVVGRARAPRRELRRHFGAAQIRQPASSLRPRRAMAALRVDAPRGRGDDLPRSRAAPRGARRPRDSRSAETSTTRGPDACRVPRPALRLRHPA